jgi:hypothetical protein
MNFKACLKTPSIALWLTFFPLLLWRRGLGRGGVLLRRSHSYTTSVIFRPSLKSLCMVLGVVTALSCGSRALAQNADFSITWSSIDGGGATSTGGVYTVSGTIGQPDAGIMFAGSYQLVGGFWGVLQTPGAPLLKITRSGGNVILSWPDPSPGWHLQQTSALPSAPLSWTDVSQVPSVVGAEKQVSLSAGPGNKFFRLAYP